jgi:hypothetical protein
VKKVIILAFDMDFSRFIYYNIEVDIPQVIIYFISLTGGQNHK